MAKAANTQARLVDQRARGRADQALKNNHLAEWTDLYEAYKAEAIAELEQLPPPAVSPEHPTRPPEPVRLKPGPRLAGQAVTDRVDVGNCVHCRAYHDRGHRCARCGTIPRLGTKEAYSEVHRLYNAGTKPELIAMTLRIPLDHVHRLLEEER